MSKRKRGFVVYPEDEAAFEMLSDQDAGRLVKAMIAHHNGRPLETIKGPLMEFAWGMMRAKMDESSASYEENAQRNAVNGRLGGRPRKTETETGNRDNRAVIEKPEETETETGNRDNRAVIPVIDETERNPQTNKQTNITNKQTNKQKKIQKKKRMEDEDGEESGFAAFWAAYPKKKAAPRAMKAWAAAMKLTTPAAVMAALARDMAADHRFREAEFTPYPASWLNAAPWLDGGGEASGPGEDPGKKTGAAVAVGTPDDLLLGIGLDEYGEGGE